MSGNEADSGPVEMARSHRLDQDTRKSWSLIASFLELRSHSVEVV